MAAAKPVRVKWVIDYGDHYASEYARAVTSDREDIIAYATIVEESVEGVVHTYIAEYGEDGWEARGLVEDTEGQIGYGRAERIK